VEIKFGKFTIAGLADADGNGPSSPSGLTFDGTRTVQVDEFIRGEHPSFTDRDNRARTVSFSAQRQHASYGEAEMFCLEHEVELPVVDDLVFRGEGELGGALQRIAKNAALVGVRSVHRGVQTTHNYQFMFGAIQKAKVTT
jgi:hypothetical protein